MDFRTVVQERYAVKKFDASRKLTDKQISDLLDIVLLAPSSFNIQPWRILVISDQKLKETLSPAAWGQPQISSCSHLMVFCANSDIAGNIRKLEELIIQKGASKESIKEYVAMMHGFAEGLSHDQKISWAQRQLYIALGNAVNGAKALGFDSGPMEGFNPEEFSRILKLPANVIPTALCAVGYAADEPHPKVRFSQEDIVERR